MKCVTIIYVTINRIIDQFVAILFMFYDIAGPMGGGNSGGGGGGYGNQGGYGGNSLGNMGGGGGGGGSGRRY